MIEIVISVCGGIVELKSAPSVSDKVIVILHDYDINKIEKDNPNREYGKDILGDYEIIEL